MCSPATAQATSCGTEPQSFDTSYRTNPPSMPATMASPASTRSDIIRYGVSCQVARTTLNLLFLHFISILKKIKIFYFFFILYYYFLMFLDQYINIKNILKKKNLLRCIFK